MSRIRFDKFDLNIYNEFDWQIMNEFFITHLPKFEKALSPFIKLLK